MGTINFEDDKIIADEIKADEIKAGTTKVLLGDKLNLLHHG